MAISIFYTPYYKDLTHISDDVFIKGRCNTCSEDEFEMGLFLFRKIVNGKFPGSQLKLKKRITNDEYSKYSIVFITSRWFSREEKGFSNVMFVQAQSQNLENCKSYEHKYIDREIGVIILEKTEINSFNDEPSYKHWFYEKDIREELPEGILEDISFSTDAETRGVWAEIKKLKPLPDENSNNEAYDYAYDTIIGKISGEAAQKLLKEHTCSGL